MFTESKGNAYWMDTTGCKYSFDMGNFSPNSTESTVNAAVNTAVKGAHSDAQYLWSINYVSNQQCATNNTQPFTVEVAGFCNANSTSTAIMYYNVDACHEVFMYVGKGACPKVSLNLDKYLTKLMPFIGIILLVIGGLTCFAGGKLLAIVITSLVFILVTSFAFMVMFNFLNEETTKMWVVIVVILVACLFGALAGFFAFKKYQTFAGMVIGGYLAVTVVLMLLKLG